MKHLLYTLVIVLYTAGFAKESILLLPAHPQSCNEQTKSTLTTLKSEMRFSSEFSIITPRKNTALYRLWKNYNQYPDTQVQDSLLKLSGAKWLMRIQVLPKSDVAKRFKYAPMVGQRQLNLAISGEVFNNDTLIFRDIVRADSSVLTGFCGFENCLNRKMNAKEKVRIRANFRQFIAKTWTERLNSAFVNRKQPVLPTGGTKTDSTATSTPADTIAKDTTSTPSSTP